MAAGSPKINPVANLVACIRCGRVISRLDGEFVEWEPLPPDGKQVSCPSCLSGREEQILIGDMR